MPPSSPLEENRSNHSNFLVPSATTLSITDTGTNTTTTTITTTTAPHSSTAAAATMITTMITPKVPSRMISHSSLPPLATNTISTSTTINSNSPHPSYPTPINSIASFTSSGSVQASPIFSPSGNNHNSFNKSRQGSPDGTPGRDYEFNLTPLELPESAVTSRPSYNAMSEAVNLSKSPGIIRRLSNRASQLASSRRRPSSNAMHRDHSTGPVIMRRRSDSTNTAPDGFKGGALFSDSDDDRSIVIDMKEENSGPPATTTAASATCVTTTTTTNFNSTTIPSTNESSREILSRTVSAASSCLPPSTPTASGPVIPSALLQGTRMMKLSGKKKKFKMMTFILDNEAAKVCWDKNKPSKSFYIDNIKDIRIGADARNYRQEFGVSAEDESKFFSIVYVIPDKSKGRAQKIMHLIANDEQTFELWTTTLDAISKHRQDLMASLSSFNEKAVKQCWQTEMNRKFQDKSQHHSVDEEELDFGGVERLCRSLHINGSSKHLNSQFSRADLSGTGRLNFREFQEFVKLMKRREDVRMIYNQIATNTKKGISMSDFFRFLKETQGEDVVAERSYWEGVFAKFVRQSKTKDQLVASTVTVAPHLTSINMTDSVGGGSGGGEGVLSYMNESALSSFLISTFNVHLHTPPASYTLDRPLNEYFISSSHNTYLLGRQVAGQSSVEAYISVLSRGCRCVEVDCWNGSDGPVVMHGRTLTSQVSFADVMSTISKYAFVKSPFPLCISLEVHCNPQQQSMMVDIIKRTCGSKLITAPLDPTSDEIPSPSRLRHRIFIKVKEHRTTDESVSNIAPAMDNSIRKTRNRGNSLNSPYFGPTQLDNSTVSAGLLPPSSFLRANTTTNTATSSSSSASSFTSSSSSATTITTNKTTTNFNITPAPAANTTTTTNYNSQKIKRRLCGNDSSPENQSSNNTSDSEGLLEDMVRAKESSRANKTSNIIKELGELGVYTRSIGFPGFDAPESKSYNHIFSFMENTFDRNSKTQEDRHAIVHHNMRHLMRVYPNGWRVASTNFDPLRYWRRGVQMVALNWQTFDLGMQINQAMFSSGTDLSGYVLKPHELREDKFFPCTSDKTCNRHVKRERKNVSFSIDMISAQQLMRPKSLGQSRSFDPYIEVEVYHADDKCKEAKDGISCIGVPHRRRTQIISENGFNPIFNNKFNFSLTTKYPDLVFIRWTVRYSPDGHNYHDKGTPLAICTAKLSSLKQGYRTLPLFDCNGDQFLFSTLFCRIKIQPFTSIYVNDPETNSTDSVGVLKTIGRAVLNRTTN